MPRFVALVAGLVTLSGAAQARTLSPADKQLVSRLSNEWKTTFRSISTLDMQWKWSSLENGNRHTYNYHFTREPKRHRLDVRFYSWKTGPGHLKSTTHLAGEGFFKNFEVNVSGSASLSARRFPTSLKNPYGTALPLLEIFGWAMDGKSHRTLESFSSDEFWESFAPRVTQIEAANWQGKSGYWLSVQRQRTAESERSNRVFIEAATSFPSVVTGRSTFQSKEFRQKTAYVVQVSKTQPFWVNEKQRLLPLGYVVRTYEHNLLNGQRTSSEYSVQALAPVKINAPIAPQQVAIGDSSENFGFLCAQRQHPNAR